MKNQKGFSLIELLIVVVIIGIIAAIAIPNLLASRRSANEGSAISSLRTIHGAEMTYQSTTGAGNFASLTQLGGANLIDTNLTAGSKSGYAFVVVDSDFTTGATAIPATFAATAKPTNTAAVTATGTRNFGIATEGVIASQAATGGTQMSAVVASNTATFGAGTAMNN